MATSLIASARSLLHDQLRSRVAGDDADEHAAVIWGEKGERRFGPGDPIWAVHTNASMFPGGVRALLVQSLHPLAMAAVAGHSGYRGDPWGRLARTSQFLAGTTFGTIRHADERIATVRAIHDRIRGFADDGTPYHASDPHLLRWVHVAEVDSFLRAYQQFGEGRLSPEQADTYVAQAAHVARALGATQVPETVAELDATIEAYRPELRATEAALDTVRFLLYTPPLPIIARPGYALIAAGGVALTPAWARAMLKLPPLGPLVPGMLATGGVGVAAVRWAMGAPQDHGEPTG